MITAALSLGLSEEENQKLRGVFGVEDSGQTTKESQHPLLFMCHDERSMRLQQLPVCCGLDPVQVEVEMLRSSPVWSSLRSAQPQSDSRRRLARLQELLHFCTDESLSWAEVEWAFRQFVFESMHLTQVEESGLLMGAGPQDPPFIPWDDPASFIQHIRKFCGNNKEESEENQEKGGLESQPNKVDIAEIQRARVRSLREWNFAEHHDPNVFPQVLQSASETFSCVDMLPGIQDNAVFVVCHNPMSPQRQSRELWDIALHTEVGFRKYLEHVAESISDWTNREEERRQALEEEREAERLNTPTPSEHSEHPRKRSRGSPKRTTGAASPLKSPCPEDPALELHIRQDSLKAWKMEQDRLREEELTKKPKKEKEGKGGLKGGERSQSSRASKKTPSATRRKREEAQKSPESAALSVDGRTELQPPEDETRGFTGYSVGGDLIQVWGHARSLFPSDGGHLRAESTHFIQGSTLVKVCVMKDKHHFFIHITEPRRDGGEKEDDIITRGRGLGQGKRNVSKFGSFSALLETGIRLSYSHHGPSGESTDETDSTLATGSRGKGRTPTPVSADKGGAGEAKVTPHCTQVDKEKPVVPENSAAPPLPPLRCLNASAPNGLLVQFLCKQEPAVKGEIQGVMVRQSFPALTPSAAQRREPPLSLELSRVITSQGTVIKHMRDGSTQVLFADGTVCNSPDSAPVCKPLPDLPTLEEEPVRGPNIDPVQKKGKLSSRPGVTVMATVKTEGAELSDSDHMAKQGRAGKGSAEQWSHERTWVTTTPSGLRVATTGIRAVQATPLQAFKATDPFTGTVVITREDRVLMVLEKGGTHTVEHADGTRITTFYQDTQLPLSQDHLETGEEDLTVTQKQKVVRVECMGFVPVMMNCEEGTSSAEFGEETVMTAHPGGSFQVFPSAGGLLCIDEDGTATYTSHPGHSAALTPAGGNPELQPGSYTMRHTNNVICEVIDPEGNLFQVMVDGETSTVLSTGEDYLEEEEEEEEEKEEGNPERAEIWKFPCIRYKEHSPRFFVVHGNGSGMELLRYHDVEDFLCSADSDPSVAVLREPVPELPGVVGVTVLRPCPKDVWTRWLIPKKSDDIIPPNLRSRRWDTFPSTEHQQHHQRSSAFSEEDTRASVRHRPGKGLCLKERPAPRPASPVLTCPEVLQARQLIRYQPISRRLRRKLERRLQSYLQHLLERELLWEEMQVKEPRTEVERVHATDLLQLVLSLPDSDSPADTMQRRLSTMGVASLYTHSLSSMLTLDSVAPSKGSEMDLDTDSGSEERQESLWAGRMEQYRQELRDGEVCRLALRNRIIPPYFSSDIGMAFALTQEVADMESLSLELPPFPRQRENPDIQEFHRDAPEPAALRPLNPTPSHAAGDASSQGRPTNPVPQTAAPPCTSPSGVPERGPSGQREGGSGHRSSVLDVAGNPRKERLKLPSAILSAKPSSQPNQRFLSVEEPVRRKVRTVSVGRSQSGGVLPTPPRGFHLLPAEVDFGVLREGYTYSVPVIMKNVGVDSCRFNVKQPPPATGLKVLYTPGPVAAGMKVDLQVELFAMASGLQDSEAEETTSYYIQIQTETEILYLPVSANILSSRSGTPGGSSSSSMHLYDSNPPVGGAKVQVGGAKVRLVSTTPSVQRGIMRLQRRSSPSDGELPLAP
ncbi:hypothetical protein AAFF_G00308190 [Aldrovandia affinis]|uniref:Sperm-associated antigen 17 n=1 Tax=Aldrovandia affinis TaxID=143900 RepID=A0AAD7SNP4_9TELE|nr:hypothetical protein AAFF_G00308190 [Aldrovandia affinis]